ncbi:MAG: glycogen debranching protein [Bacteroidetes bacterium]|nr:MAG: glycogen debranching protein [Bacteroidota bacterium]
MRNFLLFTAFLLACLHVGKAQNMQPLYQSEAFTIYPNKVVQGKNEATILSPTHIKSNYKSPANAQFARLVLFKFSINEKDNEAPIGEDHRIFITDDRHESPTWKFGEKTGEPTMDIDISSPLPTNHEFTFRVDVSQVLQDFQTKGYYQTFNGDRIAKQDFKGFYIAGNAQPLSWDFVNLDSKGMKLKPSKDNPNIYEITVKLNPYNENDREGKEWKPTLDLSKKPQYKSEQPIVDALFNLSLEEALKNIEADSTLRTGAKWGGVWTRDISYSIYLAFAYHEPEIAKISLMKKVKRNRIIQDTGSGGAYPVSSDRVIWAVAAWEIYKVTGDKKWLETTFEIVKNTLEDDLKNLKSETGMYRGESSFLDWREQTYPKWMDNKDIFMSENLGTNVAHYQAHIVLSEMAKTLGKPHGEYTQRAESIKKGINEQLWQADKGYYAQYLYGRIFMQKSPRFEALGEALAVLFNVADAGKAQSILSKSPLTPFGVTCIYPQIPNIPPYHNNAVWPFVQAYWNLASAKAGNEKALTHGLASIYRAGALFLTNYENFVAETGDYLGTEINSDRMLWSMAGNLAMVHRVFIGMNFETNGIRFSPTVPRVYAGKRVLSNFKYRQAILDITVTGFGKKIKSFKVDGKKKRDFFFSADLVGKHNIEIELDNEGFDKDTINLVKNEFSLPTPSVTHTKDLDYLKKGYVFSFVPSIFAEEENMAIYENGKFLMLNTDAKENEYPTIKFEKPKPLKEYSAIALGKNKTESFISEPIQHIPQNQSQQIQFETLLPASPLLYTNYTGKGFVEISTTENRSLEIPITVGEAGKYYVRFRYSNGSGAWNTDNACALRSLYVNGDYRGAMVFPQRGTNEWSDWGFSNGYQVSLKAGENKIRLSFEEWNNNMNVDVNRAMLDYVEIIKID